MDYSSEKIVIAVNNDLYVINTKNGEDIIKPSFVGEKKNVLMTENGVLLIGSKKEDMVMMVDNKGKISWSFNTQLDIGDAGLQGGIQTVNDNYVFIYSASQEVDNTDDPYWMVKLKNSIIAMWFLIKTVINYSTKKQKSSIRIKKGMNTFSLIENQVLDLDDSRIQSRIRRAMKYCAVRTGSFINVKMEVMI